MEFANTSTEGIQHIARSEIYHQKAIVKLFVHPIYRASPTGTAVLQNYASWYHLTQPALQILISNKERKQLQLMTLLQGLFQVMVILAMEGMVIDFLNI